ncbi:hypothetical protein JCM11641_000060 [Rhodosporidiobolus odoratus]
MASVYSEPTYLHLHTVTSILSETRPTRLSPSALAAFNFTLDELLHIIVHAALHSAPPSASPKSSPALTGVAPSLLSVPWPLAPAEVLTTDRIKSSLARILGPTSLAKECVLEAELAIRELIRRGSPSLRGDGSLKKSAMWATPLSGSGKDEGAAVEEQKEEVAKQTNEVFRALRAWIMQICGLGAACYSRIPGTLSEHLVALSPPKPPPQDARSDHLTFLLALYVERVFSSLATHLLRLLGSVSARSSSSDTATVSDLQTAMMEDDLVWSWAQGMRVRQHIEEEARVEQEKMRRSPLAPSMLPAARSRRRGLSVTAGSPSRVSPAPSSISVLSRKASMDGAASTVAGRTSFDSGSVRSGAEGLTYTGGRKGSLGLGISGSQASSHDDDSFDHLLSSDTTIKLSSTPDRLRTFEQRDGPKRMVASSSMPALPSPSLSPSGLSRSSSSRRLEARDPQQRDLLEEAEEETDEDINPISQKRKESLMDLLNSPPPWSPQPSQAYSGRLSVRPGGRPVQQSDDPLHPMSVAMRSQDSQNSVTTIGSARSGLSESTNEEAHVNTSPGARMRALKAKDERRDLVSEREFLACASNSSIDLTIHSPIGQINTDLIDFFARAPPLDPAPNDYSTLPPPAPPLSPKKSRGGLRGFMSKVTGKKEEDTKDSPTSPRSTHSQQTTPRESGGRAESISGISIATTTTSPAPLPVTGFGDTAVESLAAKADLLPSPAPLSPPQIRLPRTHENGIAKANSPPSPSLPSPVPPNPKRSRDTEVTSTSPLSSIKPPRRSSSLKRAPREREVSAASNGSASTASSAPFRRRVREQSATSVVSSASTATRQLPSAETFVSPSAALPSGLVQADLASKSSHGTLGGVSSGALSSRRAPSTESLSQPTLRSTVARSASSSTDSLTVPSAPPSSTIESAPLPPVEEALPIPTFVGAPVGHHHPATRLANPPPSCALLYPVATPSPTSTPPPSRFTPRPSSPLATPPLASPIVLGCEGQSLSSVLKHLRSAMLYATTRDECVDLVEALLRDHARRVEATAKRESGKARDGQTVQHSEAEQPATEEGELAQMVEFFLSGGDLTPLPQDRVVNGASAAMTSDTGSLGREGEKAALAAPSLTQPTMVSSPDLHVPGGYLPSPALPSSS